MVRWPPFVVVFALALSGAEARAGGADQAPRFEKTVLPILQAKCLACHGDKKQKAGLDLRNKVALMRGGESGSVLTPGSAKTSLLWEKIAKDEMPPGKDKLTKAEKDLIRRWIETGASADEKTSAAADAIDRQVTDEDRRFWAFQKPVRPSIPAVKAKNTIRNPIDAFLLAALEKQGLSYSPEADRLALLRRVTFDLTGLPPTPQEIEQYLADKAPDAYEKVVDRLLGSPRYGERWARHWLDIAGYADSEGILDADYVRAAAWRYRDWVIRAVNQDKPYDRFLHEQIAGDEIVDYWAKTQTQKELSKEVIEALEATGYLRCASDTSRPDFVSIKNAPGYYFQTLDDTLKIVVSSTMGLTVQCAKCHSHKYDPIPQTDYYRMQAIFMSGYRPGQWVPQVERRLLEATANQQKEAKEHNAKIDQAVAGLRKQIQELQQHFAGKLFEEGLAKLPMAIRADVKAALTIDPKKRNEVQQYLAEKFQAELKPAGKMLDKKLQEIADFKTKNQTLANAIGVEESKRRTFAEIRAFYDLPSEAKTHLLRRGDYLQPGPAVQPGVLAVLATNQSFDVAPRAKEAKTSGRRLAFARWLTQPDHPLTGRVLVNRLWLHHFGQGIVATPDNFGKTGAPPSHPELLDWLATEFVAKGWSVKGMHRLIVTSAAYRQASAFDPKLHAHAKKLDPDNRLLWRQRLKRLEAEALRDAVLYVAGNLNEKMFGPPVQMVRHADGDVTTPDGESGQRRSVYLQVRRSQPLTFLQLFDQPVIETNCTHREMSTVASQALTLLNSDFMQRQAETLANRVLKEDGANPAGRAVVLTLGRPATERERQLFQGFLDEQASRRLQGKAPTPTEQSNALRLGVTDLCHMLLSANEFAYID